LVAVLVLGCESPPKSDCRSEAGEGGISIDCPPSGDGWSEQAEDEALEGFEERAPGSRP
jgi:hypothetical protein